MSVAISPFGVFRSVVLVCVAVAAGGLAGCDDEPPLPALATPLQHVRIDRDFRDVLDAMGEGELAGETLIVEFATNSFDDDPVALADRLALTLEDGAIEATMTSIPYAFVHVDSRAGLGELLASPVVRWVHRNETYQPTLAQSLTLIGQPVAAAAGYAGTGTAVAVLDTGLDHTRAAFGTCPTIGAPGCRVVESRHFVSGDTVLDNNGHGTNVAGIIAGVAPDAKLLNLDVCTATGCGGLAIIQALDFVNTNAAQLRIVAINMSLGGGAFTSTCPNDAFAAALRTARNQGVLAAVASGNDAFLNAVASPACVPEAVSVGAVYDANIGGLAFARCSDPTTQADKVACFSNTAPFLKMLAPGAFIDAAGLGMTGTSQATPHVAGSLALLAQAFPGDSMDIRVSRLLNAGRPIVDHRTGLTFPRLDVGAAIATAPCMASVTLSPTSLPSTGGTGTATVQTAAGCAWSMTSNAPWLTLRTTTGSGPGSVTFDVAPSDGLARTATVSVGNATQTFQQLADTTGPTGTVTLTGVTSPTNKTAVTVALTASDPSGVTQMCLSPTTTCVNFVPFAATANFTLVPSAGVARVFASFKDARGNKGGPFETSIAFDATPPTNGTVTATVGDRQVTLNWTGFTDPSRVVSYIVMSGATAPASCSAATALHTGPATTFTHSNLNNGVSVGYRVCGVDDAGNVSTGVAVSAKPVPEQVPPTGTIAVVGAPAPQKSNVLPVLLSAQDASRVTQMCLSATTTCTTFVAFSTTGSVTVPVGSGARTVNAFFRDEWGNTMLVPATATVVLDMTLPTNGTVTSSVGDGFIDLTFAGFADAQELIGHRVVFAANTAPATCAAGTTLTGNTLRLTTGIVNGTTYGIRVCGEDSARNLSTGVVVTAKPVPEFAPPTAEVTIAGQAPLKSSTVTLNITATDASRVTQMCLTAAATCTSFVTFNAAPTFTMPVGSGERTVKVFLRDEWGNTMTTPASATTRIDTGLPTNGTATVLTDNASVTLAWSGFADAEGPLAGYRIVAALTTAPTSCAGTPLVTPASTDTTTTITSFAGAPLVNGTTYGFRLCAVDAAGNFSSGVALTARPVLEKVAPTATVSVVGTAPFKSSTVPLAITATDASRVTQMCLSTTTACTAFVAFNAAPAFAMAAGSGERTVNVFLRDEWGNTMTTPATATTTIDVGVPTNGAATAATGDGTVTLSWSGFADAQGPLAGFRIVGAVNAAPANCAGTPVVTPGASDTTTTVTALGATALVNGTTYGFRICAVDLAGNLSTGVTLTAKPVPEKTPPTGAIGIVNANAPGPLKSSVVTVTLAPEDPSGPLSVCLSSTTTCTAFAPVAASKTATFTMVAGTGTRTVNVWFRDVWGNTMAAPLSASVDIDTTLPVNGAASAVAGNGIVTVGFSGFTDAQQFIGHRVAFAPNTAPSTCATGIAVSSGSSLVLDGLVNGTTYGIRVCGEDAAHNFSTGVVVTAKPVPETDAPTASVVVVGTPPLKSATVTLGITATDASTVTQMCLSATSTCTSFVAFNAAPAFTFAVGTGSRTVNVFLRDQWGNTMTTPASAVTTIDTVLPTNGTVTAQAGDGEIRVTPVGFADTGSGLAGLKIVAAATTAPANCAGTGVNVPADGAVVTLRSIGTLTFVNGTTYGVRVCGVDVAGNLSTGVAVVVKPVPETTPPVGTVAIVGAPTLINTTTVSLALTATDASTVTQMCITAATTCTAFETFAATKTFVLPAGPGARTISAFFRDQWGNTSTAAATTAVNVDVTPPTNGTITATPGNGTITVSWAGAFADAQGALNAMKVAFAVATAPTTCATGTVVTLAPTATITEITGLVNGTTYGVRVCAEDLARNLSSGVTATVKPVLETNPPTSPAVTINGGASVTKTTAVTLQLSATDESAVTQVCVSNTATCTAFAAFAASKPHTLPTGDGTKTVTVFFRDTWGNTSVAATASIRLDATAPTNGALSALATSGGVTLNWSGFADAATGSGIANVVIVAATGALAPANCSTGRVVAGVGGVSGTAVDPGAPGLAVSYRACGVDVAGNVSSGVTATATPLP